MSSSLLAVYRESYRGLPRTVWLLSLVLLVHRSGTMVLPFLALYLTSERGFDAAGAGLVIAAYGAGSIAGMAWGGWASDRLHPKTVQLVSLVATAAGFAWLAFARRPVTIVAALLLASVVGDALRPATATFLARTVPPPLRPRTFALRRLAINLGTTVGPALGGFLALYGYGWLFAVDAATCLAAAALLALLVPRRGGEGTAQDGEPVEGEEGEVAVPVSAGDPALAVHPASEAPAEAGEAAAAAARPGARASSRPGVGPWRDRSFLFFALLLAGLSTIFFQLLVTFPLTLRDLYGLREDSIGLLYAVNTLLIVAVEMPLVHALSERRPMRVIAVGALATGAGLALLPLGRSFAFAAFSVAVWTVGEMLTFPLAETAAASRAGRRHLGRYLGVFSTAIGSGLVLAPLLGGPAYEAFGPIALWAACGLAGLAIAAGLWRLSTRWDERPG